jgi:hypothetical protein
MCCCHFDSFGAADLLLGVGVAPGFAGAGFVGETGAAATDPIMPRLIAAADTDTNLRFKHNPL